MMPFMERPGSLYVAPLGTDYPKSTIEDGTFIDPLPPPWLFVKATAPARCRWSHDVETVEVSSLLAVMPWLEVVGQETSWWFGPHTDWDARLEHGERFAVLWEAKDCAVRLYASQAVVGAGGALLPKPRWVEGDALPQSWWDRLLRRPVVRDPSWYTAAYTLYMTRPPG